MEICSFCRAVGLPIKEESSGHYQYHHSSIFDLIASSKTCSMCNFLLDLYPKSKRDEILDIAHRGSYTKLVMVTLKSGDPQLVKNPAFKYLEISTQTKAFESKQFALTSANSKLSHITALLEALAESIL